ncbi:conserved hypothetical protein [methanotrophic bacterial endosymbiont of Bathymodiolus sp.]|nr:conserved hypothetical protein [methanotrophic bacterial endosymbiont of Bathymodiolus sp.]
MFLNGENNDNKRKSLPHARGGVSVAGSSKGAAVASSPRPWGCFLHQLHQLRHLIVFPTPVGVFPFLYLWLGGVICLPHARGGVSLAMIVDKTPEGSSPRPWGCFHSLKCQLLRT